MTRLKNPEQALASLMRLASRSEKSSGDALRLMHNWGIAPADREKILETLVEQRFIDDRRYSEAYVREKSRLNGWGEYKIRRQLAMKGVPRATVDEAMRQLESASGRLGDLLERKLRNLHDDDPHKLKGKLFRYALSLGYPYDDVVAAVGQAVEKLEKG